MGDTIKILGIAGSIREGSYNRFALRAAGELLPDGAELEIFDISDIPMFNQDDVDEMPPIVVEMKRKVTEADALLFSTPEYNYSVPGVLKNVIDWGSRPYGDNSWDGKPTAIMGASTGILGTARAQYHLRQVFVALNMYVLNRPEVMIAKAAERFDEEGNLVDEQTKEFVKSLMTALVKWTRKMS
ncbi:MAG: NAD(P)H-dependent oxidoreductase [Aridibacter famidurans]|nr:NAD(P)H-dependent oxidoreductase [Aridibacter famidurans]